jgi:hypothetical protein
MIRIAAPLALLLATATALPQDAPQRVAEKPHVSGTPQCRFRQVPELLLTDYKPPAVKKAAWSVSPAGSSDGQTRISFTAQPGERVSNWQGIQALHVAVQLHDGAFQPERVTRAEFLLDGQDAALPVTLEHKPGFGAPFGASVRIVPRFAGAERKWMERLERASTATVRVWAANGRALGPWTFDVSRLRLVPAALKGAGWTCG